VSGKEKRGLSLINTMFSDLCLTYRDAALASMDHGFVAGRLRELAMLCTHTYNEQHLARIVCTSS
jgi:hypothetical protein